MGIQPESAGPHAGPMDGIKNYGFSDIVMSEFWSPSPHRPRPNNRFFLKQASSAAHIYGKKIVGAESFTTIGPHWNDELWHDQKSAFDHEICAGLNRMYFHTFTCSPPEMGLPGQEYFAGHTCKSAGYLVETIRSIYRLYAPDAISRAKWKICSRCAVLLWRPCTQCIPF